MSKTTKIILGVLCCLSGIVMMNESLYRVIFKSENKYIFTSIIGLCVAVYGRLLLSKKNNITTKDNE